jgi:hypothetical protein
MQCDERWSFVGNNGKQPWIWLALDVETREIVGVSVGDRRYYGSRTARKRGLGGRIHAWPRRSYQCPTQYPYPTQASRSGGESLVSGIVAATHCLHPVASPAMTTRKFVPFDRNNEILPASQNAVACLNRWGKAC